MTGRPPKAKSQRSKTLACRGLAGSPSLADSHVPNVLCRSNPLNLNHLATLFAVNKVVYNRRPFAVVQNGKPEIVNDSRSTRVFRLLPLAPRLNPGMSLQVPLQRCSG